MRRVGDRFIALRREFTKRAVRVLMPASVARVLKNVVYLHGFASSPSGRKATALRERLASTGIAVAAPDLNVPSFERLDFATMTDLARREIARIAPAVVVGSSLGALVALGSAGEGPAPLVLIAPALGFGRRWIEKLPPGDPLPFFHHGTETERLMHRRFFEEMAGLSVDRKPPAVPVVLFMGTEDESVPFDGVRRTWERWEKSGRLPPGSRFVAIPGGDHGLVAHVPEIAEEVRRLASGDTRRRPPHG